MTGLVFRISYATVSKTRRNATTLYLAQGDNGRPTKGTNIRNQPRRTTWRAWFSRILFTTVPKTRRNATTRRNVTMPHRGPKQPQAATRRTIWRAWFSNFVRYSTENASERDNAPQGPKATTSNHQANNMTGLVFRISFATVPKTRRNVTMPRRGPKQLLEHSGIFHAWLFCTYCRASRTFWNFPCVVTVYFLQRF